MKNLVHLIPSLLLVYSTFTTLNGGVMRSNDEGMHLNKPQYYVAGGGGDWGADSFNSALQEAIRILTRHLETLESNAYHGERVTKYMDSALLRKLKSPSQFKYLLDSIQNELDTVVLNIDDENCSLVKSSSHAWICTDDHPGAEIYISPKKFREYNSAVFNSLLNDDLNEAPQYPSLYQASNGLLHEILHHLAPEFYGILYQQLLTSDIEAIENLVRVDTRALMKDFETTVSNDVLPIRSGKYNSLQKNNCFESVNVQMDVGEGSATIKLNISNSYNIANDLNGCHGLIEQDIDGEMQKVLQLEFTCDFKMGLQCSLVNNIDSGHEIKLGNIDDNIVLSITSSKPVKTLRLYEFTRAHLALSPLVLPFDGVYLEPQYLKVLDGAFQ
tara:strand:+ start:30002 stop:31159 length:1158 start_codon:yes stop_codon:yes gene_type:complete